MEKAQAPTAPKPQRVKYGSISLPLYLHERGWRWAWKDPATGQWKYGTRRNRKDALAAAHQRAVTLSDAQSDLTTAIEDPETASLFRRVLDKGITHADIERLGDLKQAAIHPLHRVADEFIAAKESARGASRRNIRTLQGHIDAIKAHFPGDPPIAEILAPEIEAWITAGKVTARTRKNRRGAAVTLWRWARSRRYLPDESTAAERTERPIVIRAVPTTWTPAELAKMWEVCPESHRPWLALSSWGGVRGEEAYQQDRQSGKDVIRWSDLQTGHLSIRPIVAKTGRRRLIPICPALAAFLAEERGRRADEPDNAPICTGTIPSQVQKGQQQSITTILGQAVGGWKSNALRHSFLSYRAAQVGIAKAALEAGNSESEARRSYVDSMTEADATAWFDPFGTSSEPLSLHEEAKIVPIR